MKQVILSLAFALAATAGAKAQTAGEAVVTATLNGVADGTELVAELSATHRTEKPVATATVKDGKAEFVIPVTEPRLFGFRPADGYFLFSVMAKGGEQVNVSLDAEYVESGDYKGYETSNVKVSGSTANDEYAEKYVTLKDSLNRMYEDYHTRHKAVLDAETEAWKAKDTLRRRQIRESAEFQEFANDEAQFFKTVEESYKKAVADNKETWWGPFLMLCSYSYFTEENKKDWAQFSDEAKNSFYGQLLNEQINPKGFVGENLPAFDLRQADGSEVAMASCVESARYYLVDFWASWCGPCRKEIPNLKKLYEQYKDKGLQIVSVSIDKDEAAWKKALNEEQLPWPNGLDRAGIADNYKVKFIPAIFLVDNKTGKCIAENIRGEQLAAKLSELFD